LGLMSQSACRNLLSPTSDFHTILPVISDQIRQNPVTKWLFVLAFSALGGLNIRALSLERLYRIMAHFPGTASARVFAHVGQRRLTSQLYKYDYGAQQNLIEYGTAIPPTYDLARVTNLFIVFFTGSLDILADPADVEQLRRHLTVPLYRDIRTNYSHSDFMLGNHVNITVNLPVLDILHGLGFDYN